ncbi:DUF2787 family protein [Vibrio jasicida]|uniref:DUF2787 family protein n=1 Tax=Vibrio jasicida TaxID=766224 RepID=UPI0039098039
MSTSNKSRFTPCTLSISEQLHNLLTEYINTLTSGSHRVITLNFRDTTYSPESGGFHPVEIGLQKTKTEQWSILYITDFAYAGSLFPELERSVDFDITNNQVFFTYMGWQSIDAYGVNDFYQIWESNFLSYIEMNAFDEIKLSSL